MWVCKSLEVHVCVCVFTPWHSLEHTHTHTHALFTCEFIAAINEYVCSNKPIFYVQKSREKLFSTVKSAELRGKVGRKKGENGI